VILPPLLTVSPSQDTANVNIFQHPRCVPQRAGAFGAVLVAARQRRGLPTPVTVFAAEDPLAPDDAPGGGLLWVPHLYRWCAGGEPGIAWELCREEDVAAALDASVAQVRRWGLAVDQLLRLARLAGARSDAPTSDYLSMRWILSHEREAAAALCDGLVQLEHLSLHVTVEEQERLVAALVEGLGLVEVSRPATITVPGRWLQAGDVRIHLNSRTARADEPAFPGTAPNHVCFAVLDFEAAIAAVEAAGFDVVRAGSLGDQAWWRLASGTTVELQPLRRPHQASVPA
jgi:hypothetical protein